MKKTLIAIAALAVVGAASAQVTLSGGVRAAVQNSGVAAAKTTVGANDVAVNNLTITAVEDLGGGLTAKALYVMRNNIANGEVSSANTSATQMSTTGAALWRNTSMALSGAFGEVRAGRWGLAGLYGYDSFGATGTIYTFSDLIGGRYNSMLQYSTPNVSGVSATLGFTAQGSTTYKEAAWAYVNYANGPLAATIGYEKNQAATAAQVEAVGGGIAYDLGTVKLMAGYANKTLVSTGAVSAETYNVGATVPVGAATGKFAYVKDNTSGYNTMAVGVDYALSKTTGLFADIGKSSNLANATFQVGFQKGF